MAVDKLVDSSRLDAALTATADAIRAKTGDDGTIAFDPDTGFSEAVEGIDGAVEIDVFLRDYDGTLVYGYSKEQFIALSALPEQPVHEGMVAQGWNWNLADAQAYVEKYGMLEIGPMYNTVTGATEIDIELEDSQFLSPVLYIYTEGTVEVDWGDGSDVESFSGTIQELHTYPFVGEYTLSILPVGSDSSIRFYSLNINRARILCRQNTNQSGVTSINESDFCYLKCIKRIRLGDNYVLDNNAFGNTELDYISFSTGSKINELKNGSFGDCDIGYVALPTVYTSIGNDAFYNAFAEHISVPNTIEGIGDNAFKNTIRLTCLTLPDSVKSIGDECFGGSCVERVVLGGVTELLEYAFDSCNYLEYLDASNVTSIESSDVFSYSNPSIRSIRLGDGLTTIPSGLFSHYNMLSSVLLPNSVTTIGSNTFNECKSLGEIIMPEHIATVGLSAFNSCESLESVVFPEIANCVIESRAFYACRRLKNVVLPEGLEQIKENTFSLCMRLSSVVIPSTVTEIKQNAFSGNRAKIFHMRGMNPPVLASNAGFDPTYGLTVFVPQSALSAYKTAENWSAFADCIFAEPETDE